MAISLFDDDSTNINPNPKNAPGQGNPGNAGSPGSPAPLPFTPPQAIPANAGAGAAAAAKAANANAAAAAAAANAAAKTAANQKAIQDRIDKLTLEAYRDALKHQKELKRLREEELAEKKAERQSGQYAGFAGGYMGTPGAMKDMIPSSVFRQFNVLDGALRGLTKGIDTVTGLYRAQTTAMTMMVKNDFLQAQVEQQKARGQAMKKAFDWIPLIGDALGGLAQTINDSGVAVKERFIAMTKSLTERAQYVAPFSANLSMALAQERMAEIFRRMDDAERNGDKYAEMIREKTRLEDRLAELGMEFRDGEVVNVIQKLRDTVSKINENMNMWGNPEGPNWRNPAELMKQIAESSNASNGWLDEIYHAIKNAMRKTPLEELWKLNNIPLPNDGMSGFDPALEQARKQQMNRPVFEGGF